jgi:hypothetical protein
MKNQKLKMNNPPSQNSQLSQSSLCFPKVFKTLGATNHSSDTRQPDDFYATDPVAAQLLLQVKKFNKNIWECACGEKHLSNILEQAGYNVRSSDIINRCGNEVFDFLSPENKEWSGDIVTNPPYKYALQFVEKSLQIIPTGHKVAMFLRLLFLEGKARKRLFLANPPHTVYVSSSRILCAKNADFNSMRRSGGSAQAYAWFVWHKGYKGDTIIKWIN